MKSSVALILLGGMTFLAVVSAVVLARSGPKPPPLLSSERTFQVAGKIVGLDPAAKTVRIAHEAIPEYMSAMTMPFTVKDARDLKGLAAGDCVEFQLVVTETDSWVARLSKVRSPSTPASVVASTRAAEPVTDLDKISIGEKLPAFTLTDQDGRRVRLSDFRGQAVLLTFIYTRCPLPNYCPLLSKNFASLQERLSKAVPGRFHLLSVSIDPEFDQPEILKSYATRYEADPKTWSFLTGSRPEVDALTKALGLTHEPENGFIAHDLRTALIAPDGKLVQVWKSNVWTPYEVERRVRETLGDAAEILAHR